MRCRTFRSLFSAAAGVLLLAGALVPKANAVTYTPIVYFNFEDGTFNSVGPFDGYTFLQNQTITNVTFPSGLLTVQSGVGTTLNELSGDTVTTNSALNLGGSTQRTRTYCFEFGANTTGYTNLSLSFALNSIFGVTGPNPQFSTVSAYYSVNGGTSFTLAGTQSIIQNMGYKPYTFDVSGAANTSNAIIELCFSGSGNQAHGNATYIDNIQLNAAVPEPATTVGGMLGVVGLCWFQRRWLIRFLHLRRA